MAGALTETIKNCPRCGYRVEQKNAVRCPRCFMALLKPGRCGGSCSNCGVDRKSVNRKCPGGK